MAYFVTGATGFIGRHLVERLLTREGTIYVLVRPESIGRLDALIHRWGGAGRIRPVLGDLSKPLLGLTPSRSRSCAARSTISSTSRPSTT